MSKKFTEYSQLNLSEINKEVLKTWDDESVSQFMSMLEKQEFTPRYSK